MKTLSQDNFILEVEKNIDAINKRTTKRALIAIGVVVFLVLLYGAVMNVDVTVKMITIAITPIPVIALIIFAYVDKAIRPLIEKELAESTENSRGDPPPERTKNENTSLIKTLNEL